VCGPVELGCQVRIAIAALGARAAERVDRARLHEACPDPCRPPLPLEAAVLSIKRARIHGLDASAAEFPQNATVVLGPRVCVSGLDAMQTLPFLFSRSGPQSEQGNYVDAGKFDWKRSEPALAPRVRRSAGRTKFNTAARLRLFRYGSPSRRTRRTQTV